MQHTRTWSDVYGSACAAFEGRPGGYTWLVASSPELAATLSQQIEMVDGKGSVELMVYEGLTPLLAYARDMKPRGVVVVAPQPLSSGPALRLQEQHIQATGALEYLEGGEFGEWQADQPSDAPRGECGAASAVASLGLPLLVCTPDTLAQTLEGWMARVPHGR